MQSMHACADKFRFESLDDIYFYGLTFQVYMTYRLPRNRCDGCAGFQVVGVMPEHQPSAAPEVEPLQEEAAVPRESAMVTAPTAPIAPATSHTLESRKSAGFAVDFGDTASSGKGVHPSTCLSLSFFPISRHFFSLPSLCI